MYASGFACASASSAVWMAGAPLPSVIACCTISSVDPCGVHASMSTAAEPVSNGVKTPMMMPPTWVNGNATSAMSSSTTCVFFAYPIAPASTERSVWRAPFGSAVVPDV